MSIQRLCFMLGLVASAAQPLRAQASDSVRVSAPRLGLRTHVLGCWRLREDDGSRLDTSRSYNAAERIRLDSAHLLDPASHPRLRGTRTVHYLSRRNGPRFTDASSPQGLGSWRADSLTDSLRLSFSDGFSGVGLVVAAPAQRADTLRGRLSQHWDFGPPFTTDERAAILVRFACPRGRRAT